MEMINTYESYLKHPSGNILKFEDAFSIYAGMAESIEKCRLDDKIRRKRGMSDIISMYAYISIRSLPEDR